MKVLLVMIAFFVLLIGMGIMYDAEQYEQRNAWIEECHESGGIVVDMGNTGFFKSTAQCVNPKEYLNAN